MRKKKNIQELPKAKETLNIQLFMVRNQEGQWLNSRGWYLDIKKAKIYTKAGSARAQITFWANKYPQYGTPDLIAITSLSAEVFDQTERTKESIKKMQISKLTNNINSYKFKLGYVKSISDKAYWQKKLDEAIAEKTNILNKG